MHVPGLPEGLDRIVQKLCHPYPEGRFRSAEEVCQALRSLRRDLGAARQAEAFFGDDVHEKWVLAKNAWNNGQLSLAASIGGWVARQRPDFAPAHFLLAKVFAERGLRFNAIDAFQQALELQPDNSDYRIDFAVALLRFEDFASAHVEVMRLLATDPEHRLAAGLECIVREEIGTRKEREMAARGGELEVPLWFDTRGARPESTPRPPTPPTGGAGGLAMPGVLSRVAAQGSVPAPPPTEQAVPAQGAARPTRNAAIESALALLVLGLVACWSPESVLLEVLRMAMLVGGSWALLRIWLHTRLELASRRQRLALEGRVVVDLGDGQVRVDLGARQGARVGLQLEVLGERSEALSGASGPPPRLGLLRLDRVREENSEGRFLPAAGSTLHPSVGDRVRIPDPDR